MAKKGSGNWIERQASDHFVRQRNQFSTRSRAFFKLTEINKKRPFIKKGHKIIDLGAAPGGWSEAASRLVGQTGHILSVDSKNLESVKNSTFLQIDCLNKNLLDEIEKTFSLDSVDAVISDMAPNLSGIKPKDEAAWLELVEVSMAVALAFLKKNGVFLVKFFQFGDTVSAYNRIQSKFDEVQRMKPVSSRTDSSEFYVIANGKKSLL